MQSFRCDCGARIFFENTRCLSCERELAFVPWTRDMIAVEKSPSEGVRSVRDGTVYRKCSNYREEGVCNWLVSEHEPGSLCQACRLNRVVPDLAQPENRALWATMESAKRRLLYSLNRLGLPTDRNSPELRFDIRQDTPNERAITGHSDGLITLNLAEADPVAREEARIEMNERYRTPLGHFRHEIGHYYWDLLVRDSPFLTRVRSIFGDERADYAEALRRHYASPRTAWVEEFVSAYASSHPWEDWAETFAHYLHIADSLDTAHEFGFSRLSGYLPNAPDAFAAAIDEWSHFALALNAINRSMGLPDTYPFELCAAVRGKLMLLHRVVTSSEV